MIDDYMQTVLRQQAQRALLAASRATADLAALVGAVDVSVSPEVLMRLATSCQEALGTVAQVAYAAGYAARLPDCDHGVRAAATRECADAAVQCADEVQRAVEVSRAVALRGDVPPRDDALHLVVRGMLANLLGEARCLDLARAEVRAANALRSPRHARHLDAAHAVEEALDTAICCLPLGTPWREYLRSRIERANAPAVTAT